MNRYHFPAIFAALITTVSMLGEAPRAKAQGPAPTPAHMQWWRDARFGMFIHWGPVSIEGKDISWSRDPNPSGPNPGGIPASVYDNLYKQFNPVKFSAPSIVKLAQTTGMKYIVLVCKHHDGFCEFDSKYTNYKITSEQSPYGKDIVKQMAAACHAAGVHFCVYYSQPDVHNPDYSVNQPAYDKYLHAQVHELLTNYGEVDSIWFDGLGHAAEFWDATNLFAEMRAVNPNIIINDRCGLPGDYYTPEQTIGAYDDQTPWETCMTVGTQWAYKPNDSYKSGAQLIQALVLSAGGDGNYLLNIGPEADGEVDPTQYERLQEIGAWMKTHHDSIYKTRGGPYIPTDSYAATREGDIVYVHVLNWNGDSITLPLLPRTIVKSRLMGQGRVQVADSAAGLTISVPKAERDAADTVVVLTLDGSAMNIAPIKAPTQFNLTATASNVYHGDAEYAASSAFDDSDGTRWATDTGANPAWLQADFPTAEKIDGISIKEAIGNRIQKFQLQYRPADGADWVTLVEGNLIGPNYDVHFDPISAKSFRLNVLEATDGPTISEIKFNSVK